MMLFKYSVDKDKFKVFLEEVRAKYPFDDICFYMDNLRVHTSLEIKERMDELGFAYIYSPAYSPDFNPIETVFSLVKCYLKKQRLAAAVNGYEIDMFKEIKVAFDRIDVLKI